MTENEMVGWHHQLNGHEFEQASEIGDGQGGLVCCSPWGLKELDMTERLSCVELMPSKLKMTVLVLFMCTYLYNRKKKSLRKIQFRTFQTRLEDRILQNLFSKPVWKDHGLLATQLCPTLCDPRDCNPASLLCPYNSPSKNTRVGSHSLLQGIFPKQGSNPGSPTLQADSLPSEPPGKLLERSEKA